MDDEEFVLWRDYIPDEDLKDITQLEGEQEKILRKEEKEKVIYTIFLMYLFNLIK